MTCNWKNQLADQKEPQKMVTRLHSRPTFEETSRQVFQVVVSSPDEVKNFVHDFVCMTKEEKGYAEITYLVPEQEQSGYGLVSCLGEFELENFGIYLAQYWYQLKVDDMSIIVVHDVLHSQKKSYSIRLYNAVEV